MSEKTKSNIVKVVVIVVAVYFFLLSIKLLGHSFKLFGEGFAESLIEMTSNPFVGLLIGIVATSLIQSSSTTSSIVVGMVAGDILTLAGAIPVVMGANIGTTITNTLVSMAHVTRRAEFRRAFSASIVHDLFNICAVVVLFPLELKFHLIEKIAVALVEGLAGAGGLSLFNPLKLALDPVVNLLDDIFSYLPFKGLFMAVASILILFTALGYLVKTIRSLVLYKVEIIINQYLFRNDLLALTMGMFMTLVVQSSSVTTSIIIPLAGAGVVGLRQVFPYTLGANFGTTGTTILAALATQNEIAITVAFAHLTFNAFGIVIFYPLRFIPIGLAEFIGRKVSLSRRNLIVFLFFYLLLYILPLVLIFL